MVTGTNGTDADRLYNALTSLTTAQIPSAIEQLSLEKLQVIPKIATSAGARIHTQLRQNLEARRNLDPTSGNYSLFSRNGEMVYERVVSSDSDSLVVKKKYWDKMSYFASVNGEQGDVKPSEGRTDFDDWSASALYGGNYALSDKWNLGIFTGYGHTDTSLRGPEEKCFMTMKNWAAISAGAKMIGMPSCQRLWARAFMKPSGIFFFYPRRQREKRKDGKAAVN